jgi:hypothetical protein
MAKLLLGNRLLSRRGVLRNAGAAALLAPVLRRRDAHAAPSPRRVIFIYSGNGPIVTIGPASGTEREFTLHDWWKPLERHRAEGVFFSHLAVTGSGVVTGGGHGLGGQLFSGFGAGAGGNQYAAKGESVDQVIARRLEAEGRAGLRRSVVWGLARGATGEGFQSTGGRNIQCETDPAKAWQDLFASFVAPPTNGAPTDAAQKRAAALLARDQSVLDIVNQDCKSVQEALGAEGTRLLDEHCTSLRALEKNLTAGLTSPVLASCAKPANPGAMAWTNPENIDAQAGAFFNLMTTSLACELTHVIAFQFSGQSSRNRIASKYGVAAAPMQDSGDSGPAHHPWTHNKFGQEKVDNIKIFMSFYATQVALLLDKLRTTVDAQGVPLIESTVVVWGSELGGAEKNPDGHQTGALPALWFGKGQGQFRTGRYIKSTTDDRGGGSGRIEAGRDMARILVSAIQYMGLKDVDTVGATGVKGGHPGLV